MLLISNKKSAAVSQDGYCKYTALLQLVNLNSGIFYIEHVNADLNSYAKFILTCC